MVDGGESVAGDVSVTGTFVDRDGISETADAASGVGDGTSDGSNVVDSAGVGAPGAFEAWLTDPHPAPVISAAAPTHSSLDRVDKPELEPRSDVIEWSTSSRSERCAPNRSDINLSSEPFPQVRADRASIRTADSPRAATSQVGADVEDLDDAVIASTPQDKVVIGSSPNDEAEHRRLLVTPTAVRRVVLASDKSSKLRAQIAVQQLGLRVGLQAQQFGASVFRDPEHTTSLSPTCDRCDDGTTGTRMSAIHLEHAVQCRP